MENNTEQDLYFKFLDKLSKKGLFGNIDVSNELQEHFKTKTLDVWQRIGTLTHNIDDFLSGFIKYGHFTYTNETKSEIILGQNGWIDAIKASISLTPTGLLFLYEKKKIDQADRGLMFTKITIGITVAFSFLAFLISFANYKLSVDADKQTIRELQADIKRKESLIQLRQAQIDNMLLKKGHQSDKIDTLSVKIH